MLAAEEADTAGGHGNPGVGGGVEAGSKTVEARIYRFILNGLLVIAEW